MIRAFYITGQEKLKHLELDGSRLSWNLSAIKLALLYSKNFIGSLYIMFCPNYSNLGKSGQLRLAFSVYIFAKSALFSIK
jgi:hypothetical protein